jgi:hypothetical protein
MGAMYQRNHYNGFGRQCIAGCVTFASKETGVPGDPNFTTGGGNPFASFLLGYVDSASVDTIRFIGQQWPYFAGYFQDDWRVNSRLTLNLGIRWETALPPVEQEDRWMDFSPTRPNPAANNIPGAIIFAGTGTGREGTRSLADSWFGGWGPHVGMAFTLTPKTVIRSSYALFRDRYDGDRIGAQHRLLYESRLQQHGQWRDSGIPALWKLPVVSAAAFHQSFGRQRPDSGVVAEQRGQQTA